MIDKPYVLFTRIPLIKSANGHLFCDPLWGKDLRLHLNYLGNFGICCPIERRDNTEGLQDITGIGIKWFFELKKDLGLKSILINLLPNFFTVIKACRRARIVHSDGAGWPFPLSFYLLFLRPLFFFKWIIVIESSFWMLGKGDKKTPRKLIEHYLHGFLLSQCVRMADARIFTQSFYMKYFLRDRKERTLLNPATWIDEEVITTLDGARQRFEARSDETVRIIYPSRLEEVKGARVVMEAIKKLREEKRKIHISIMGSGELEEECQAFANNYRGSVEVVFKKPVAYGRHFFETLIEYDFVLVPTVKQEQPRIIFDAFSQGVPVIASDTQGILDVTSKCNACTFKAGDASSLAESLRFVARNRGIALEMGLAGLDYVVGKTHLQMHKDREKFLNEVLLDA